VAQVSFHPLKVLGNTSVIHHCLFVAYLKTSFSKEVHWKIFKVQNCTFSNHIFIYYKVPLSSPSIKISLYRLFFILLRLCVSVSQLGWAGYVKCNLLYRRKCFTGKYTTRKIHTKPHPGLEWHIFHILTSEDIDDFINTKFV